MGLYTAGGLPSHKTRSWVSIATAYMAMEVSLSFKVRKSWKVEPTSGLSDLFKKQKKQNKQTYRQTKPQNNLFCTLKSVGFYELIY